MNMKMVMIIGECRVLIILIFYIFFFYPAIKLMLQPSCYWGTLFTTSLHVSSLVL